MILPRYKSPTEAADLESRERTTTHRKPPGRWRASVVLAVVLATLAWSPSRRLTAAPLPELRFESPPALAAQVTILEQLDREPLIAAMHLVGLDQPGPPIRVVLAVEGSADARRAPSWAVAYAIAGAGLVVLIPSRVPGYPDNTIDTVLTHEIAHVLIGRAAGHQPIPRWFNEGLAIHAAREWSFEDRARVALATVRRDGVSLQEIERRFQGGSHSASSAYALSAAFMRFLRDRHGSFVAARILDQIETRHSFPEAFRRATGTTLALEEQRFWQHLNLWNRWIPFLTSSATLWMLITTLALWAFKRRRQRNAEQVEAWEAEEQRQLEQATTTTWVN